MGCFNVAGFFSKLPLQSGDDMVLIFCADTTRVAHCDNLPIYVAEKLIPLNAPIYCKYNDYGSLEDIIRDANVDFFEKSIGMSCEKLCSMIHDFGNINLKEVDELKKECEKESKVSFYEKRLKELEVFENVLKTFLPKKIVYNKWRDKIGLTFIMEHKDIYESVSKIAEGAICNDWRDDTNIVEKRCEKAFNMVKDYPKFDNDFNLLNTRKIINSIQCSIIEGVKTEDLEELEKKYREVAEKYGEEEHKSFFSSGCLFEGGYLGEAFPTYRNLYGSKKWEKLSKNFIDFFRFTRVMFSLHRIFEYSTYASQSIYTKPLSKVTEIINNKAQSICKEYDEMYSSNED